MPRYDPFELSDALPESVRVRLPEDLVVSGHNDPEILLLIRLLSGNLSVKFNGAKIPQRVNYFSPSLSSFGNKWGKDFSLLVGENIVAQDVARYISRKKSVNKPFYREILFEVLHFSVHKKRGSHTSAFIYIYRLLERVSYCFPLIYVSMTEDFKRTYNLIKSFFGDSKDKDELGFFKTFINTVFEDDEILSTTVDFDFNLSGQTAESAAAMCAVVKNVLGGELREEGLLGESQISIRYENVGRFIIALRNGFVHNLSRKDNLRVDRLKDSDNLFEVINDKCVYWISSILLAVITYNMSSNE